MLYLHNINISYNYMKTEVEMQRKLFGVEIAQKSKSEFFSATDLVRAGNKWRMRHDLAMFDIYRYFHKESTKEFVDELEREFGIVIIKGKGRNSQTWVHPLLFIDMALTIHPRLKIKVYKWLQDNLLRFRNISGDSYKEMCAALYTRCTNYQEFPKIISDVAIQIRKVCEVEDWQHATEKQLNKRDNIHKSIKLLCKVLKRIDVIIEIAIDENE
jgi:hypothetical protein